jgi:tryptophan-rich sensory protein
MSHFPDSDEWIALFVWIVLFAFQISTGFRNSSGIDTRLIYRRFYKQIPGAVSPSVFSVWFVWYIFLAVGSWEAWRSQHFKDANELHYNLFVLFAFMLAIILKFWMPVFTGALDFGAGLAIIVVVLALLTTIFGFAIEYALWTSVGLFAPVLLFVVYALYLNASMLKFQSCASQLIKSMRIMQAQMYQSCMESVIKNTRA